MDQLGLFLQRLADAEPILSEDPALKNAALSAAGLRQARLAADDEKPKPPPAPPAGPFPSKPGQKPNASTGNR
jgi:hypothetical protein